MTPPNHFAVIMAGGRGERFWPLGRLKRPKQFLPLFSEKSLLEETVGRLSFPLEQILILTSCSYVQKVRDILPGIPPQNILGEPLMKDTAACLTFAAAEITRRGGNLMTVLPADHRINDKKHFNRLIAAAAKVAALGHPVTVGITPDRPETGFGYIEKGESLMEMEGVRFSKVRAFREKPDLPTAQEFLKQGNFCWNAGIFLWRTDCFREALGLYAQEHANLFDTLVTTSEESFQQTLEKGFEQIPKISIDFAVMEKLQNIVMADALFDWDDAGSWLALRKQILPDVQGNVLNGNAQLLECRDCIVRTDEDHLIGMIGVDHLAVIQSGNATLLAPPERLQEIKALLEKIRQNTVGSDRFL